jgi:hypothetical protein
MVSFQRGTVLVMVVLFAFAHVPTSMSGQEDLWHSMIEGRRAMLAALPGYDSFPENATTWPTMPSVLSPICSRSITAGSLSQTPGSRGFDPM